MCSFPRPPKYHPLFQANDAGSVITVVAPPCTTPVAYHKRSLATSGAGTQHAFVRQIRLRGSNIPRSRHHHMNTRENKTRSLGIRTVVAFGPSGLFGCSLIGVRGLQGWRFEARCTAPSSPVRHMCCCGCRTPLSLRCGVAIDGRLNAMFCCSIFVPVLDLLGVEVDW